MTGSDQQLGARDTARVLTELRQLEREILELEQVRRADALERVREAVRRIGEIGSPEGILERAGEELGQASRFERVLVSEASDATLMPRTLWSRDGSAAASETLLTLREAPIPLDYPLIEAEVATRQNAMGVIVEKTRRRASEVLANALGWDSYVVAALTLHGATIGLLHAGMCSADRRVDALDQEVTEIYASGLAESFERAALRQTLQRHRQELQDAVRWMSGRLSSFSADVPLPLTRPTEFDAGLDSLTRREREVLQLLTKGNTNGGIAHALVISEGTAKYHVKNILRKLQATSRAEAVAHYLRGTAGRADV